MNACVFLGPTLPVDEAARILDAVYLPPAAQGDVLAAVDDGADVIGIVDGYFQGAPSVWHKEILWAMSRGVHVYGCSSMGALRAAELAAFGMQGVGRVFEAYRDGDIEDDDEVAVVHGPEEMGYRARTEPLVNMRASLAAARTEDLISDGDHEALIEAARSLFYWDRTYEAMLERSAGAVKPGVLERLAAWLPANAVDQKRADAVEMLERLGSIPARPLQARYQFQRTSAWDNLLAEARAREGAVKPVRGAQRADGILDELRLEPDLYRRIVTVIEARARTGRGESRHPLLASLIECGHYDRLAERAHAKERVLSGQFGGPPEYADAMLTPSEVLEWYFADCLSTIVPMDLEAYAREIGLDDAAALNRLLLHELLFEMSRVEERAMG